MRRALPALLLSIGCATAATAPDRGDEVKELTRLSDAWDKAAIADNMSEDFRQIDSGGGVAGKSQFVSELTADDLTIDPYTVEELDVRVYGDVALLSGRTRMAGREGGKQFTTHYRYIDVYRRIDGKWRVCSVQTTRMPK
jgi:ketosteroid isomerase-like protein